MTHVLNVPALDVRSVGKFRLRGRDFHVQFRWMDCAPEATLRNGFCRAEENFDLVSKLRRLLPGKETRSAEENLERPRTDASGI